MKFDWIHAICMYNRFLYNFEEQFIPGKEELKEIRIVWEGLFTWGDQAGPFSY